MANNLETMRICRNKTYTKHCYKTYLIALSFSLFHKLNYYPASPVYMYCR